MLVSFIHSIPSVNQRISVSCSVGICWMSVQESVVTCGLRIDQGTMATRCAKETTQ